MWSETRRPETLDGIIGHTDIKARLQSYLSSNSYKTALLLYGPPGIGKTTLALAASRTCGFETLEINASRSLRSFADVDSLTQSCRNTRSISSLLRGDQKPMCLVLDEIDGSDPHAQRKLVEWISGTERKLPVILTCNEVPRAMKQCEVVELLRCFPPKPTELTTIFPAQNVQKLAKQFKHDVRRMLQFLQYGESDALPTANMPTDCSPEVGHILRQKMWIEKDPIEEAIERAEPSSH